MRHVTHIMEHTNIKQKRKEKAFIEMFHVPCSMFYDTRGQALIIAVVFFLIITTTVGVGVINPVLRQVKQADDFARARASLFVSQSVNEDAVYRIKNNKQFVSPSTLSLNGYVATATSTAVADGLQIYSSGNAFNLVRNIQTHLTAGSGTSFYYGMQSGSGGMTLNNTATVVGNVFSNGPITGANSNIIKGTVVSAGPAGIINGVHATSSAYAHSIQNSTVGGDAYYVSISGSTVAGALYPGSPDQATSSLPISDAQITQWENDAVAGGTVTCSGGSYNISGSVTLGPKKIPCDLYINGSDKLYLTGPLWVTGNIQFSNTSKVAVDGSLSGKTVAIIADNPSNQTSSSKITASNSVEFQGAGANSYILLISQNKSAEQGGGTEAIEVSNSVNGKVLVYAGHGKIEISNSVNLKEVTAYKISVNNSAQVIYESGLANLLFTSGPAGGYVFDRWQEIQ